MPLIHQDITAQLPAKKFGLEHLYHYKFNNSMVLHSGNTFYGVYRCLINKKAQQSATINQHQKDAIWNRNWKTIIFDGLGVFVAKFGKDKDGRPDVRIIYDEILDDDIVDARIFSIGSGKTRRYYIMYNTNVYTNGGRQKVNGVKSIPHNPCNAGKCTAVALMEIQYEKNNEDKDKFNVKLIQPQSLPCLNVYGGTTEKNWAFLSLPTLKKGFKAVYGVAPFTFIESVGGIDDGEDGIGECKKSVASASEATVFDKLQNEHPGKIFFSSGASMISFKGTIGSGKNKHTIDEWIGIGHVKFKYKQIKIFPPEVLTKGIKEHGGYVYMNYFFTIKKNNPKRLHRISHVFHVETMGRFKYALNFCNGITRHSDNIIVSFGDGDISCNTFIISEKEVNDALSTDKSKITFIFGELIATSDDVRKRASNVKSVKVKSNVINKLGK